ACVATVPGLVRSATSSYADVPMAAMLLAAVVAAMIALESGETGDLRLALVLIPALLVFKKEGAILAALICAAFLVARRGRLLPVLVAGAALFVLVAGPWLEVKAKYGLTGRAYVPVTLDVFRRNVGRLGDVARFLTRFRDRSASIGFFVFLLPVIAILN